MSKDQKIQGFVLKYTPKADFDNKKAWLKCQDCGKLFRKAEGYWIIGHPFISSKILYHEGVTGIDKLEPGQIVRATFKY